MQTGKWRTLVQRLYLSRRDTAVTMGILLGVSLLCLALWQMDPKGHDVAELYLLAVFLISRFTTASPPLVCVCWPSTIFLPFRISPLISPFPAIR